MTRTRGQATYGVLVAVLAITVSGCAAIVGADFDVTARPLPADPDATQLANWRFEQPSGDGRLLGLSVALEGDTALVGSRDTNWVGRVYVLSRNTDPPWGVIQTLTAGPYAQTNAQFGSSAALSGDWAVIGARGDQEPQSEPPGAAYFFRRIAGQWTLVAPPAQAPKPAAGDKFGGRVAIDGNVAVIGAPGDEEAAVGGAAYVYTLGADDTWAQGQTLTSSDEAAGDAFGSELALQSSTLVVGAPNADEAGQDAGAAYVFERSGTDFIQKQKLLPRSQHAAGTQFGSGTIGLDAGLLIVPSTQTPPNSLIDAFKTDSSGTWVRDVLAPPPSLASQSTSEWRAVVHGSRAVLSVRVSVDTGAGLLYQRDGDRWRYVERLESGSASQDVFGWTIAFDGSTACFGAIFYRDQEGAAYFFDVLP